MTLEREHAPGVEDIQKALKPFGINVYDNKLFESDYCYCILLSHRELDEEELVRMTSDYIDEQNDVFVLMISLDSEITLEELGELEELFKIFVHEIRTTGSTYGFLFSNERILEKELDSCYE